MLRRVVRAIIGAKGRHTELKGNDDVTFDKVDIKAELGKCLTIINKFATLHDIKSEKITEILANFQKLITTSDSKNQDDLLPHRLILQALSDTSRSCRINPALFEIILKDLTAVDARGKSHSDTLSSTSTYIKDEMMNQANIAANLSRILNAVFMPKDMPSAPRV